MKPGKRTPKWLAALVSAAMMAAVMAAVMPLSTAMADTTTIDVGQQTSTATVNQDDGTDKDAGRQADAAAQTEPQTKANDDAETQTAEPIYVGGSDASDANSGTDSNHPLKTLSAAVSAAQDGATIYVMGNITMTKCARFFDKSLTITSGAGEPYTLSRGSGFEHFESTSDNARSWYNPALIEVANTSEGAVPTQLTLTNIVLDDGFTHEGEYFVQAASEGGGTQLGPNPVDNLKIVQDAMVASYAPSVTINLGQDAILKDFGGMSAVRVTGGAHLMMHAGSKIYDSKSFTRTKGTNKDENGPAGAIWSQGGKVTIENGASIENVNGRAIYMDGGTATVDGTISGIKSNNTAMWQGNSGFMIHLRGGAQAEIGAHGVIDGASVESSGTAIEVLEGCQLTADEGSVIKNLNKGTAISTNGNVTFAGEITGCRGWAHAITAQSGNFHIILEPTAYIHDNHCSYGAIYIQSTGGVLDVYGRINDNLSNDRAGGIAMANNFAGSKVNMYDKAEICGNVSYQTGGGIMVSRGTFTMYGGTIANNISGVGTDKSAQAGGGVFVRRGGQFIMNGGIIENNTAAGIGGNIAFEAGDWEGMVPYVQLNGGSVKNGTMKANIAGTDDSYTTSGGEANDIAIAGGTTFGKASRYLSISDKVKLGDPDIYMERYGFSLDPGRNMKVGNAGDSAKTPKNETDTSGTNKNELAAVQAFAAQRLTVVRGSFWYQTDEASHQVSVSGLDYDKDKPLYAAIVPTGADGLPASNTSVTLRSVKTDDNGSPFSLDLPGLSANGYAVVFLQQGTDKPLPIVTPADMTVYEGGDGYESVVGGQSGEKNTMPRPLFRIEGANDAQSIRFANGAKSWTAKCVKDAEGGCYYSIDPTGENTDPVRVTYTDADGRTHISDEFDVSDVNDTYKQFIIGLYLNENDPADITAQIDGSEHAVAVGTGTLTVRAVQDDPDTVVSSVEEKAPSERLPSGTAIAVAPKDTEYTLNDTGVPLGKGNEPSLLFDDILTSDDVDRKPALKERVDEALGGAVSGRQYEMKYLDLVDANDSNAWITSSKGVDVYWAYPEGTGQGTDFALLHFEGLHRDGDKSGYDVSDIQGADVKVVKIEKTTQGIRFHVDAGGFSPFVLAWSGNTGGSTGGNTGGSTGGQTSGTGLVPVYRLYNPYSCEHLYTMNKAEYSYLASIGWNGEDVAFHARPKDGSMGGYEVHRLYNPYDGWHHLTASAEERDSLVALGWVYEGVAFRYSDTDATIWRGYNRYTGDHLWTTSRHELDVAVSNGWDDEGIAYGRGADTD